MANHSELTAGAGPGRALILAIMYIEHTQTRLISDSQPPTLSCTP